MGLNSKKHFAVVVGARPNFIKAVPFLRKGREFPDFEFTLIHTGQHFDHNMSKIFFDELMIPYPDVNLAIDAEFHTEKIGKMLNALQGVFRDNKFGASVVFGDVNSTLVGALAASRECPVVHVEAGLRSHDRRMPEEINRVIVDHLSDLLFTTEPSANKNLITEGVTQNRIKYVGNLMIESIEMFRDRFEELAVAKALGLKEKSYVVTTLHRQENVDEIHRLREILLILNKVSGVLPVAIPLHPGTAKRIAEFKLEGLLTSLKVVEPLGYFEFLKLVLDSKGVITDSGGIQEETSHLGIPCCTLRDNTERPITLELGTNRLFPPEEIDIDAMLDHLHKRFTPKIIPLWDNKVSQRIFETIVDWVYESVTET